MNNDNSLEKVRLHDKLRETLILCSFIFMSAIACIVVMDLVIFPVAGFAIAHKKAYTMIFKYSFWVILAGTGFALAVRAAMRHRKNGLTPAQIALRMAGKPGAFILWLLGVLGICALLFVLLYLLLNYNDYLLYRLAN
ncbi:MAG: hypothetical protein EPN93_00290 [Spirochaetes bacterium]|nr:MAG: hypothetical protein EPN93_00290 [Spirochaetota bacterium]